MELRGFVLDAVGDAQWSVPEELLTTLQSMDWEGMERDAAVALIRHWYWEPRVAPAERCFFPGGKSRVGFLAWGEKLETTLAEDRQLLAVLGWTPRQLGLELKRVLDAAQAERERQTAEVPEEGVAVGPLCVQLRVYRGFQACPFPNCEHTLPRRPAPHSDVEFHLTHRTSGAELRGPGIAWHLIAAHGFFGGKGSPYRIDPELFGALLAAP